MGNAFMKITGSLTKHNKWELLILFLAIVSLTLSCMIVSSKKYFWNDELISYYLVSDKSFIHMINAWGDKFNNAPPLYFILGWFWAKLFGSKELVLRLFSSFSISFAFLVTWITLRRTFGFWSSSIATLSVFCSSELILYHNSEVRMYGLFFAVCALGLLQFDIINRSQNNSYKSLAINTFIHGAIVLTHLYGILYSGAILSSFIIRDIYVKKFRLKVYISLILGWLFLIPFLGAIVNQADIANPRFWITSIDMNELLKYIIFSKNFPFLILAFLLISVILHVTQARTTDASSFPNSNFNMEIPLLIFASAFLLVPFLAWVITITVMPILLERYITPTIAISWPIFLAFLISHTFPNISTTPRISEILRLKHLNKHFRNLILIIFIAVLISYPIYYGLSFGEWTKRPGANDNTYGYEELPMAVEAGHDFLPRNFYSPNSYRYFDILDWETAFNNTTSLFATGDYKALDAIKRNYPHLNIVQSNEFLNKFDRFIVLNELDQQWFETRIDNNPEYFVKSLGKVEGAWGPLEMYLVEKKK